MTQAYLEARRVAKVALLVPLLFFYIPFLGGFALFPLYPQADGSANATNPVEWGFVALAPFIMAMLGARLLDIKPLERLHRWAYAATAVYGAMTMTAFNVAAFAVEDIVVEGGGRVLLIELVLLWGVTDAVLGHMADGSDKNIYTEIYEQAKKEEEGHREVKE